MDLHDLMKLNYRKDAKTTKGSCDWLTDTTSPILGDRDSKAYFCEYCLIIQSEPSKHCKLCEGCCAKFDHHCLFISKFIFLIFCVLIDCDFSNDFVCDF